MWPPPPRPRPRQGVPTLTRILILGLILALIAGGLSLLVIMTNGQYTGSLKTTRGFSTNATARSEIQSEATRVSALVQTAVPLATAQARIVASATAQEEPSATALAQAAQEQITASAQENMLTQDIAATPVVNDPLTDNSMNYGWDVGYSDNNATGCHFGDQGYEAQEALLHYVQPCFASATNFHDFVYQVTMTISAGSEGGIIFRANKDQGQYYLFRIDTNGDYALEVYNGNKYALLVSGNSSEIYAGIGVSNDLTVIAQKNQLTLFANNNYIASVSDKTLSSGQIGVAALNADLPATVDFSNAQVWTLS